MPTVQYFYFAPIKPVFGMNIVCREQSIPSACFILINIKARVMEKITTGFFTAVAVLGALACVSSCSKNDPIAGTWQGAPERIAHLDDASDVSSVLTFDFSPSITSKSAGTGTVLASAVIEVQQPVVGGVGVDNAYAANVTATASVSGTYALAEGEDNDYLLVFDPSTLKVTVDPSGVVFAENVITGMQQPQVDSLTAVTVERWRMLLTPAVREQFYRYRSIDDVKVHHGSMMSCEVDDKDLTFRRTGVPD